MALGAAICYKIVSGSHVNFTHDITHIITVSIYLALCWSLPHVAYCLRGKLDILD